MNNERPGATYEPSNYSATESMIDLAGVVPGGSLLDLGAGDGRVVIEAAKRGINACGAEIDPVRVSESVDNILRNGVDGKASIHYHSFWDENFGNYDAITVFQDPFVMKALQRKVLAECKKGTRIVSHRWKFPDLTPAYQHGSIFVYVI